MLALDRLLEALLAGEVRFVVIGGVAVGVHGVLRATEDLDICPDPDAENLTRLAALLGELHAVQVGLGDFDPSEMPFAPTDPAALAEGGNFRLTTDLGALDILQWVPGIEGDHAYAALADGAVTVRFRGGRVAVCSLTHLRTMKRTAGRPQDLEDLRRLELAKPEGGEPGT